MAERDLEVDRGEEDVPESAAGDGEEAPGLGLGSDPAFERLLVFLKESRSFDFTGYKRPSLVRRVQYRMHEVGVESYEDYQDVLQLQPDEFTSLFNTILINVTSFFRDAESWGYIRDVVLPELVDASNGGPVRVWSAGSAAGQEAYTVAMLLHDLMGSEFRERVKIYATDVDEEALDHARQATYSERELAGLPEEYRERYFDQVAGRYVFTPDVRRNVIFGRNDLTRDAPISRIDLLLCRNTLMYFNAETQARIVNRLAFALRPRGVLFLGKAEMLLNHSNLFDPVDLKRRMFRRIRSVVPDGVTAAPTFRRQLPPVRGDDFGHLREEVLLTAPIAQIAVGADGRLVVVNHRASALLGLSDRDLGRPFQDLEVSYRPIELRSHLAAAIAARNTVALREIDWRRSGPDELFVDIQIVPLLDEERSVTGASISFTDVTRFRQLRVEVEGTNRQLEVAYEELQSTNEELETTNEELQSTVEELETTNEELQSTNEELETMNEELQSANDEMQSTNDLLADRTREITDLNAFMQSIMSSFEAAMIVVGRDLKVQVWTPQAYELWGLRADEAVGTGLLELDSGLPTETVHAWLEPVLAGSRPSVVGERLDAVNRRGRAVILRVTVTPLSTGDGLPSGALVLMEELSSAGGSRS
ncbi:CheR family methyltransferase [uncultured Friedmanniella sp.]|uniref:CheR family methyltransferase n=1 Tax=uncultured Friedmanniella sp. TaxID=335381 RepID=UPI0035CB92E0